MELALPSGLAATRERRRMTWLIAGAAGVVVVAFLSIWFLSGRLRSGITSATGGQYYAVRPIDLAVTIQKDAELAAVNNIDILCRVEGQTTIQTLVKEGATVKKGDILITLDSSTIKQKIEDTTLELQKAEADLTSSKEMREIQLSQNNANLDEANVALTLAKLDLQGYVDGTYPEQLAKAKSDVELAQLAQKNAAENLSQTRNLFVKNFVTATDIKKAEQDLVKASADLSSATNALEVLAKYTHESDLASKNNALSQAEQKLVRTQKENAANLTQKNADVQAKAQGLEVLKRRMERYVEQLAACTIIAPTDGLVVYATSGDRNAQSALQEGAQVRERQALLRLPDTSSMKAVARIGEAQVWRLREGQRAKITLTNGPPVEATLAGISVLADNTQRWMNPDVKEYPVDLVLDSTPAGVKPGMGVKAEILIDRADNVLAVPLPSIFSADQKSYVFVRNGDGEMRPVEVKIGRVNDKFAEVKEGLTAGQEVKYLQIGEGQMLLARAGIKVATEQGDGGFKVGPGSGLPNGARRNGGALVPPGGARPEGAMAPAGDSAVPIDPNAPPTDGDAPRPTRRGGGRRGGGGPGGQGAGGPRPSAPDPNAPAPDPAPPK